MRIAVLADAHGNLPALQAVLADLHTASPDLVVNLGDLTTGPFDPAGSADVQMALDCPPVAGNHERNLLEGDDSSPFVAFARRLLSAADLQWIGSLPESLQLADGDVFACHGSPAGGDLDHLLEDVSSGRPVLAPEDAIRPRLHGSDPATLVLCGHTHMPRVVQIGPVLLVKPGQHRHAGLHRRRCASSCDRDRCATCPLRRGHAATRRHLVGRASRRRL